MRVRAKLFGGRLYAGKLFNVRAYRASERARLFSGRLFAGRLFSGRHWAGQRPQVQPAFAADTGVAGGPWSQIGMRDFLALRRKKLPAVQQPTPSRPAAARRAREIEAIRLGAQLWSI